MSRKILQAFGLGLVASAALAATTPPANGPSAAVRAKKAAATTPVQTPVPAAKAAPKPATAAAVPNLPAMTAEQVVARNVAARGGLEAWRAVSTLTMSGQIDAGGKPNVELPFVLRMKRGHKSRLEIAFKDQTAVQVYDGAKGWKVRPFLNRNEVEPYTEAEAKSAAAWPELDGLLIDHAAKGTKVELVGTEAVEGNATYKLKLTLKGGSQRYVWIDGKTYLESKIDGDPRKLDGRMRKVAIFYRDFRKENGLTTARVLETVVDGVKQTHKLTIAKVTVNEPMADMLFDKPQLAALGVRGPN